MCLLRDLMSVMPFSCHDDPVKLVLYSGQLRDPGESPPLPTSVHTQHIPVVCGLHDQAFSFCLQYRKSLEPVLKK